MRRQQGDWRLTAEPSVLTAGYFPLPRVQLKSETCLPTYFTKKLLSPPLSATAQASEEEMLQQQKCCLFV